MTLLDVETVLRQIRAVYNQWDKETFVREVFNVEYSQRYPEQRAYYDEKWKLFQEAPHFFYFHLDAEHGERFLRAMMDSSG